MNRKIKNIINTVGIITIIVCLTFVAYITIKTKKVEAEQSIDTQIASCNSQISTNNIKLNSYNVIQIQLHELADSVRNLPESDSDSDFVNYLSGKWHEYETNKNKTISDNVMLTDKIKELEKKRPKLLGYFNITHYCACYQCCQKSPGDKGYGITATGTVATEGRTIGVDPSVIPYGTKVIINGHTYVAEDTGGAIKGNHIDIFMSDHWRAYNAGSHSNVPVYIMP